MSRQKAIATMASIILGVTGILIASPPPAHAAGDPAVITLGDSYISGEAGRWQGNGNTITPGSRYGTDRASYDCNQSETWCWHDPARAYGSSYDNGCNRSADSELSYVSKVRVGSTDYTINWPDRLNVACSGATSQAIYGSSFKGERTQVSQLADLAKSKSIKVVVLSIGGNDIGFGDIIEACVSAFTKGTTRCNQLFDPKIPALIKQLTAAVTASIGAIRSTMSSVGYQGSDYRLILQSYPSPIPKGANNRYPDTDRSRSTEGGCPFYNDDSDWANNTLVPAIDDTLKSVATSSEVEFLDLRNALNGHEVCAKGADQARQGNSNRNPLTMDKSEWVRWIGIPNIRQGQKQEFLHPNYYGQKAIGTCLSNFVASSATSPACSGSHVVGR